MKSLPICTIPIKVNLIKPMVYTFLLFQMRDDLLSNTNLPDSEKKKALAGLAKDFPNGIPRCGTDALRLGLLNDEIKIQQVNLDPKVIQSNRCGHCLLALSQKSRSGTLGCCEWIKRRLVTNTFRNRSKRTSNLAH